jgi:hypothetical protein
VAGLGVKLREVAEEHLLELRLAMDPMVDNPSQVAPVDRAALMAQAGQLGMTTGVRDHSDPHELKH